MKIIILAAGLGTRLGSEEVDVDKVDLVDAKQTVHNVRCVHTVH